jgi:hypothetical protein
MELSPSAIYLGNRRFTHDEILAYHPTPPELLEMLQKGRIGKQGNGGASYPFVQLTDALREMPLPGPLAVTVVQTLPLVPGVKDEGSVTDEEGRPGHAYSRVVGHMREQVIVDPEQGTMLQERQFALDAEAAPGIEGPDLGNAVYLQRAVVDRVGQRP